MGCMWDRVADRKVYEGVWQGTTTCWECTDPGSVGRTFCAVIWRPTLPFYEGVGCKRFAIVQPIAILGRLHPIHVGNVSEERAAPDPFAAEPSRCAVRVGKQRRTPRRGIGKGGGGGLGGKGAAIRRSGYQLPLSNIEQSFRNGGPKRNAWDHGRRRRQQKKRTETVAFCDCCAL